MFFSKSNGSRCLEVSMICSLSALAPLPRRLCLSLLPVCPRTVAPASMVAAAREPRAAATESRRCRFCMLCCCVLHVSPLSLLCTAVFCVLRRCPAAAASPLPCTAHDAAPPPLHAPLHIERYLMLAKIQKSGGDGDSQSHARSSPIPPLR